METTYLTNHFLIAMPSMEDSYFAKTLTYICMHNESGAMGIIVNRPLQSVDVGDVLEHIKINSTNYKINRLPVFDGGPVQRERGFVLHEPGERWEAMLTLQDYIAITTSQDILRALAQGDGPNKVLIALGYAGWGAGQLEHEMAENTWLSIPATSNDLFFDIEPEQRWSAAAASLGIDLNLLSTQAGHS
jgi:putative transcriptional regulator